MCREKTRTGTEHNDFCKLKYTYDELHMMQVNSPAGSDI